MALISHSKGKKHKNKVQLSRELKKKTESISSFFGKPSTSTSMENDIEIKDKNQPVKPPPQSFPSQKEETSNSGAISKFGIHDEVLTAEILWAMKVVSSHYSVASSEKTSDLWQRMLPGSAIAQNFKSGRSKCSYLIQFGLVVFYKEDLASKMFQPGTIFVACFDESLNKVLQQDKSKWICTCVFGTQNLIKWFQGTLILCF